MIAKLRRTVAHLGWWNTALFTVSRGLQRITASRVRLIKYYFVAQPVRASGKSGHSGIPQAGTFRFAWVDLACPALAQAGRPPEVLAARFAQGARCLLATRGDDEFAGFLWLVSGSYEEDEVRARFVLQPAGRTAWDFDVAIAPRFRAGRLFSYLWKIANTELSSSGVQWSVSRISAFNAMSLTSHWRLGARMIGQATFVCMGQWQLMVSSLPPRWHWSWCVDQRPEIVIDSDIQPLPVFGKERGVMPKNS